MKIESSVTGRQFRFYDDSGRYVGSMRAEIRGPRIILDSLVARNSNFYKNIATIWDFVNATSGTSIWNAHVEPAHLRLILKYVPKGFHLDVLRTEEHAGREMCWIEFRKDEGD